VPGGNGKGLFDRELLKNETSSPEQVHNLRELERQLAIVSGTKKVLAVRVIHDGTTDTSSLVSMEPSYTKEVLADDVFGSMIGGSDAVNLHSQMLACSHGKLDFQPAGARTSGNSARVTEIVNGVVEVTVSTTCKTDCWNNMYNDVNIALSSAFGISASKIADDHIMHCLPNGAMGLWIAYAYYNSFNSIYSDNWCRYPSSQVRTDSSETQLKHNK
jgi:hypothetical protein